MTLIERLREPVLTPIGDCHEPDPLHHEAANEIERLSSRLSEATQARDNANSAYASARADFSFISKSLQAAAEERDRLRDYAGALKDALLDLANQVEKFAETEGEANFDLSFARKVLASNEFQMGNAGPPCAVCDAKDGEDCAGSRGLCPRAESPANSSADMPYSAERYQAALAWVMRTCVKEGAIIDSRYTDVINAALGAVPAVGTKE